MRKTILLASLILVVSSVVPAQALTGSHGEILKVSKTTAIKSGDKLVVSGQRFDETIGIYVALCTLVKAGTLPSPCGGGIDESGATGASIWISSNPPPYGQGLAIPFAPGGRFAEDVAITRKIGKFDCRKVKCAITVRSDHLHEGDRSHDIYIPITIK